MPSASPCVQCTVVEWCSTPEQVEQCRELAQGMWRAWHDLAQGKELRNVDKMVALAMFLTGELQTFPPGLIPYDCAEHR